MFNKEADRLCKTHKIFASKKTEMRKFVSGCLWKIAKGINFISEQKFKSAVYWEVIGNVNQKIAAFS